jgi:hypothetical protein
MPVKTSKYAFPQQAPPTQSGETGIASMHHPDVGSLRFRTNPNEFGWTYTLNKRIDQTYGGRVVQLLGTKIDDFTFKADAGSKKPLSGRVGGWDYMNKVAKFMRDVMVVQRNGTPATFEYTTRGWKLNCFVVSVPFEDAIEEVKREFTITCKVQEDVSGVMSKNTLDAELRKLQDGINYQRGKYNDPRYGQGVEDSESGFGAVQEVIGTATDVLGQFGSVLDFLPGGLSGGGGSSFDLGNLIGGG